MTTRRRGGQMPLALAWNPVVTWTRGYRHAREYGHSRISSALYAMPINTLAAVLFVGGVLAGTTATALLTYVASANP